MGIEQYWYKKSAWGLVLAPLSWLFCVAVFLRRKAYESGLLNVQRVSAPVVVVGNITVGGTGKTPLVAWIVERLSRAGWTPGIISRGYGGQARNWPQQVRPDSDPVMVGDEPVLLAQRCRCPVAVGPDRVAAARALLEHTDCDVVVSDDGLQHYALGRDIEIAVIDGVRRFGNERCLPAGPLREPKRRLADVDLVVCNGLARRLEYAMHMTGEPLRGVRDPTSIRALETLRGQSVHAVAGIGAPERFFSQLRQNGLQVVEHPFPDHHRFVAADLDFGDGQPILMTEKDAVKCARFAPDNAWCLPIVAELDERFGDRLLELLDEYRVVRRTASVSDGSTLQRD